MEIVALVARERNDRVFLGILNHADDARRNLAAISFRVGCLEFASGQPAQEARSRLLPVRAVRLSVDSDQARDGDA